VRHGNQSSGARAPRNPERATRDDKVWRDRTRDAVLAHAALAVQRAARPARPRARGVSAQPAAAGGGLATAREALLRSAFTVTSSSPSQLSDATTVTRLRTACRVARPPPRGARCTCAHGTRVRRDAQQRVAQNNASRGETRDDLCRPVLLSATRPTGDAACSLQAPPARYGAFCAKRRPARAWLCVSHAGNAGTGHGQQRGPLCVQARAPRAPSCSTWMTKRTRARREAGVRTARAAEQHTRPCNAEGPRLRSHATARGLRCAPRATPDRTCPCQHGGGSAACVSWPACVAAPACAHYAALTSAPPANAQLRLRSVLRRAAAAAQPLHAPNTALWPARSKAGVWCSDVSLVGQPPVVCVFLAPRPPSHALAGNVSVRDRARHACASRLAAGATHVSGTARVRARASGRARARRSRAPCAPCLARTVLNAVTVLRTVPPRTAEVASPLVVLCTGFACSGLESRMSKTRRVLCVWMMLEWLLDGCLGAHPLLLPPLSPARASRQPEARAASCACALAAAHAAAACVWPPAQCGRSARARNDAHSKPTPRWHDTQRSSSITPHHARAPHSVCARPRRLLLAAAAAAAAVARQRIRSAG
jgi:hypothetical protein